MKKRILTIEDDPDILEILNIIFEEEDYEIISNNKGMSVDEVALAHPDLVLLDVRIVGFNKTGAQLCEELKASATTSHLPVILLSAERNLAQMATACGADAYISKPFDINGLINVVNKFTS
ncbi:response regulator [Pedobacter sp. SL55]|uniref:response regulator n=1 Tax=Pedobacter sp. SL55 TaxID=2995161 RepID=UPI00226EB841|nr:response regulator [Pedobacter sp. SL55]WAC40919.1 response regulator [Pedobacter sp. SL55]